MLVVDILKERDIEREVLIKKRDKATQIRVMCTVSSNISRQGSDATSSMCCDD